MPHKRVRQSDVPSPSFGTASSPAISAVLLECPKVRGRAAATARPDCERQMMVHIRVSPTFQVETLDKFLLLDEVYDQSKKTRARLMSPYLIEISRGEPVVMYPLQFTKSIRCDTCGHKNGNNTNTSQENCEQQVFVDGAAVRVPLNVPDNKHLDAGATPVLATHASRSVSEEHQRKQQHQQKHNANEAPMENGHNPAGPRPSEQIESRQKLAIGILDSPHFGEMKKQVNIEKGFASRDLPLRLQGGGITDYDVDEYDELNLNDEAHTRVEESEGSSGQNTLRDKRLKTRPPSQGPLSSSKVSDALFRSEELFREAERQGEEARMETLRAFTRKHAQSVGNGRVAGDGYAATARKWSDAGKPHVVGIQEDCIRPMGEFYADEIDDVDSDVDGGGVEHSGGGEMPVGTLQMKPLLNKNEHQMGVGDMENLQLPVRHKNGLHRLPDDKRMKTAPVSAKGSTGSRKDSTSNSKREEANAFLSPSSKSVSGSHRSLKKEHQQRQQKLRLHKPKDVSKDEEDNDDVSTKRKFHFRDGGDSVDTQGFDASSSDDGGDRIESSVRDSTVIESKGNITSPDDNKTAAGGMGDEFYWNTLHYPTSSFYSKYRAFSAFDDNDVKITAPDSGEFRESSIHNKLRRLGGKVKTSGGVGLGIKNFGRTTQGHKRNYHDRQSASAAYKKTPDIKDQASPKHPKRIMSQANGGKFSDKSAFVRNRIKTRSSDGDAGAGGVVETSGMYTAKDGVVPAFPLNGYPGYLGVKTLPGYIPPIHSESQYRLLEKVPQEFLPHQPPYAKEISDPNLTVNDKINLLEVLSSHDDIKDSVLRNLENELDSSVIIHDLNNHDRMPMSLSRNREKKEIKKRSYLVYDDLTMRDTDEQYNDMDMKQPFDVPLYEKEVLSNNGKCQLCKGNKCSSKRDGNSCTCERQGRHCECLQKSKKKIRSVSDAWYSVFNMSAPLQFLTTRVGIYRKRHGTWWKSAPSITLTSLSGIYASENLSILFSSHVDIFQLRHPLTLQNHKLLIPHSDDEVKIVEHPKFYQSINPKDVLAIDSSKFDFNKIHDDSDTNNKEDDRNNGGSSAAAKRSLCHATSTCERQRKQRNSRSSTDSDAVLSLDDLGYFPGNMNILEQCPADPNHLCLNMLDEEAPAFTIKIKQPFLENALLYNDEYKVRIASVISDATTKGALQVAVVLVNEDCVSHEFTVCICNCPMTCGSKTTVKKVLAPHLGETVSFLLPLEETKDRKLHCNVEVKSPDQKVISKRKFMVEATARCLCIWDCECHCIQDLVSHDDYDVCHKLGDYDEQAAGFIEGGVPGQDSTGWCWFWWRMNHYALTLLLCMLFLGLLKAILGALCLKRIDRCGYDYVQPLQKYDYASRCRRFFINIVFFVVLPFICCCTCFTPSEEDLLMANTEWQCSLIQQDLCEDSSGDGDDVDGKWKKTSGLYYENGQNANDNNDDDEETILRLSQNFESGKRGSALEGSQSRMTMSEYLLSTCEFDDGEEERDKDFVMQALNQSRKNIRRLLKSHCSEDLDTNNPQTTRAENLVRQLVAANIVYRTFEMPLQRVNVSQGQKYSIQGYFMPSLGPSYQFITPNPLFQHRRITSVVGNTSSRLEPPIQLRAKDFQRAYRNKLEVLEAGDLSVEPPLDAPCINSSNTTNESQLTAIPTLALHPLPPTHSHAFPTTSALPPVDKLGSTANDVVSEHGPATANDTANGRNRVDDANNESNLTAKQKDSPSGFE